MPCGQFENTHVGIAVNIADEEKRARATIANISVDGQASLRVSGHEVRVLNTRGSCCECPERGVHSNSNAKEGL